MPPTLWNYGDIARLAPDPNTLQRARGISYALNRWQELEGNERIVWGIYLGGGHQRYQVAADLENTRFYCTCRSPQRPCKHALALPMLLLRSNDYFRVSYDPPDWIISQAGADTPAKKTTAKPVSAPSDSRMQSMQAGMEELQQRLQDIAERGLATLPREAAYWEDLAARMTDAKLPGVAARFRALIPFLATDEWYDRLLTTLADLYLLARAFARYENLPPDWQREVLTVAGVSIRRDQVLAEAAHDDRWLVVGIREAQEERLAYRRTWLLGESSGRMALLLDFNWDGRGYEQKWKPGMVFDGRLHYYPGSESLRAVVSRMTPAGEPFVGLSGAFHFTEWADQLSERLSRNPWSYALPCLLVAVTPTVEDDVFYLLDTQGAAYRLEGIAEETGYSLLAVSGGYPISLFGEWLDDKLYPLSLIEGDRIITL